jgi:DNA-binding SARP family transcriptional activator
MNLKRASVAKIARTVPAKVTPPEITGYFPRKRLFRLLDAARKRPVVWISAPPGSGKTTLASSYIDVRRLPCLWYQVDERDADVATFFYYMGLAAQKAAPRKRKPMPLLTPEYLPGLPVFARRFFDELFARLPASSVVVFDNYQEIPPESLLHEVIRDAAACLPPKVTLLMVSRSAPPPAFARMSANRMSSVIGWEEMRLTGEETKGIARLHARRPFRAEEIRRLEESAEGWVAGLVLMLEKAVAGGVVPERKGSRTLEEIVDYFGGEVFGQFDPETRSFLLATSFLPRMTAEMAHRLTGYARAGETLSALCRNNWFTQAHGHGDPVYQYHTLFREFLLSRARAALPAAEIRRLQRAAAELLAEQGQAEDAAALLRECGDWDGLARIVLSQAPSLVAQGRFRTLEEWLRALPENTLEDVPWMRYWMGVCRMPFGPEESAAHFESAFHAFRKRSDPAGMFLAWSGAVESIVHGHRDLSLLDPWVGIIDRLVAEWGGLPPGLIEARVMCAMMMALAFRQPSYPAAAAEEWAGRCVSVARTSGDTNMKVEALIGLSLFRVYAGDIAGAGWGVGVLTSLLKHRDVSPLAILRASQVIAVHANLSSRHDRCLEIVSDGLRLADSNGIHLLDFPLNGEGVLASLHLGDAATANRYLGEMAARLAAPTLFEASFYHFLAGWESLHRGDLAQASFHAGMSLEPRKAIGNPVIQALVCLLGAHVFEEAGDRSRAGEFLEEAHRLGIEHRLDFFVFVCLLTKGFFSLRGEDGSSAEKALREGMRIGREKGFSSVYLWRPEFLATVAAKALEAGIEVPYVRELIRKNRLVPDPSASDLEKWPWPVKVYTLGRFSLVVEGKVLPFARKTRQKPLLLLKALIALGGREVPEEQLSEVLWPDADGDLAHQSLAKTLERLREMLGDDRAVLLRDGRFTLNNRHCWVDAWEFERTLGRADAARKQGVRPPDGGEVARLAERAIALYGGPFLSGETFCAGIVPHRERLRSKFLRAVVRAGRHWEQAGEWDKVIACYQEGLEVDPFSEEMCRGLISCNMRMGRAAEAHAAYHRYCNTLSAVLGVSPSPDLEAILKTVPAVSGPMPR